LFPIRVVSDAGPLIWLARCGRFTLLKRLYNTISIPAAVFSEVVEEGSKKRYSDALLVKEAVDQGWIAVRAPAKGSLARLGWREKKLGVQLGEGEREAIALCVDPDATLLTNDQVASTVAKALGIDARGVLFLLLLGVQVGLVDKAGARRSMQVMLEEGFWLSPDHVQSFYEALERVKG